uniref:DNA-binding phage zinc finger domain-containing protein n=2 Tax=unclassified bacterial viruses TaxID=12333 RepID=A0AAU7J7J5_9VIRU
MTDSAEREFTDLLRTPIPPRAPQSDLAPDDGILPPLSQTITYGLNVQCPSCKSAPGLRCIDPRGFVRKGLCSTRLDAAYEQGYRVGDDPEVAK